MSDGRGSAGRTISELVAGMNAGQHLALDAVVAYVDGELDAGAHDRASGHLAGCRTCAAEVTAQRQMRVAVSSAAGPAVPASLLAALRSIPETAVLPPPPDSMAVAPDGAIVMASPSYPLGVVAAGAPPRTRSARHSRQAAGTVVSGVVLGALILASAGGAPSQEEQPRQAGSPVPLAEPAGSIGPLTVRADTWQTSADNGVPVSAVQGGWAVGLR